MRIMYGKRKNKIYSIVRHHFDRLSINYDEKSKNRKKYNDTINSIINARLKTVQNPCILDIGCGTGTRAMDILKGIPQYEYYGCDISEEMVSIAKSKEIGNIQIANVVDLPYENNQFNVVICVFNVLGYLCDHGDLLRAFHEIERVTKRNAVIFIDVMNKKHSGEGLIYHKSNWDQIKTLLKSWIIFGKGYGQLFRMDNNGEILWGYVRGFQIRDIRNAIRNTALSIKRVCVVGYDSGEMYEEIHKGQYFFEISHD